MHLYIYAFNKITFAFGPFSAPGGLRWHCDAPHRNVNGKDGQIVAGWNHQTAGRDRNGMGESSGFHRKAFTAVSSPLSLLLNMK